MQRCIADFYDALRRGDDGGSRAAAGVEVMRWTEAAARAAAPAPLRARGATGPGPARAGETVVLGGTGLIGSRVTSALRARGIPTTVLVRRPETLDPGRFGGGQGPPLRVIRGALGDEPALAEALEGAHRVVHLATGSGETWAEVLETMVEGTVQLAKLSLAARVERFIYVSSIAALYLGVTGARIEDTRDVDPRAEERDVYSRGKAETERRLFALYDQIGLPLLVVRPGVVLGPESPIQHPGLGWWPRDNHCLGWGDGTHPLPLVSADDVADAIVRATTIAGNALHGRALNLCTSVPISARDLVSVYAARTGRPIRFHSQALWFTFTSDMVKWAVKSAGARRRLPFPSYRDLASRAMRVTFTARTAREVLGWTPIEDREAFLLYLRGVGVEHPTMAL
jgi:nucleoside-diphosphate-sugar epimerase